MKKPWPLPLALFTEVLERHASTKETRSASTLSECSQNRGPYCCFSGLGDCPNNLILPFPSPEKLPTRTYERSPRVDYSWHVLPSADTEADSGLSAILAPHSPALVGRRATDSPGRLDALGAYASGHSIGCWAEHRVNQRPCGHDILATLI